MRSRLVSAPKSPPRHPAPHRAGRLAAALALAAALPLLPPAASAADAASQPLPFARIATEGYSGIAEPLRLAVRDQAEWERIWARIYAIASPPPPIPAIDFARDTVLVVAMGERMSGGFGISVDEIRIVGGRLQVAVRLDCPPPGLMASMAVSEPVQAVRIEVPAQFLGQPPEFVDRPGPDCGGSL